MSLRKSILIVGITALALALGFLGVVVVGRMAQALRTAVTSEAARQEFVSKWKPPRTLSIDGLLPDRLGELSATNRVAFSRWEEVGVDLEGVRGLYVAPRGATVEIVACRTPEATEARDRESVVAGVKSAMDRPGGTKVFRQVNDRWQFTVSDPTEHVDLWALPGWVILFRSDQEIPLALVRSYLEAIAEP